MTRFTAIVLSVGVLWMAGMGSPWATEPRYGGTYRFPLSTDPPTLDPAHITDTTSHTVASEMFNGLVQYDDQLNLVPDIAERWDLSPDKRTYTFYLKKGVRFHHGRECTAADFRDTFERVLNPSTRSPRTGFIDRLQGAKAYMQGKANRVEGITVVDPYTLRLTDKKYEGHFRVYLHVLSTGFHVSTHLRWTQMRPPSPLTAAAARRPPREGLQCQTQRTNLALAGSPNPLSSRGSSAEEMFNKMDA